MNTYPPEWYSGKIQQAIYTRAHWHCEHCGMEFEHGSTKAKTARNKDGKPVILTVHHIDGNKANCEWTNLIAVCQRCHLHIQAVWKPGDPLPATWEKAPEWLIKRGLDYFSCQQLKLW